MRSSREVQSGYRRLGAFAALALIAAIPVLRPAPAGATTWGLDPTFGTSGVSELGLAGEPGDLESQPDGKLVVALTDTVSQDAVVLRRHADGTPDTTFGNAGTARLAFAGTETATALTLTQDGMIVVGGQSDGCTAAVRRLRSDGSPDTTFGVGGQATIALEGYCSVMDVVAQPDGKLLVLTGPSLYRLQTNGTIDSSFGQAGAISVATGEPARVIALQSDGRILVGGRDAFGVRRYLPDGSLDTAFGNGGLAAIPILADRYVNAIALDSQGRIVVAGAIYTRIVSQPIYQGPDGGYVFSLARFTASGQLDPSFGVPLDSSFGAGSAVQTGFGDIGQSQGGVGAVARRLVITADGKVLAGGVDVSDAAFARYHPDGSLDNTFDSDGRLDINFGPYGDGDIAGLTVTAEGRVVSLSETRLSRIAEITAPPTTTTTTTAPGSSTTTSSTSTSSSTTTTTRPAAPPPPASRSGYWMVGADGTVYAFGDAKALGNARVGSATAVDLEPTPSGDGYWIIDDLGFVRAIGKAIWRGNVDRAKLAAGEKITSLSATHDGGGYWIFTSRGRVLTFGNATSLGDVSTLALAGPVLDSIVTPSGDGYYMVASDGGIFAFGDASFYGSMGGQRLNAPVQSLVPDSDGVGYWLVASDGGIFAFLADFKGSMGGTKLNRPVTGMVRAGKGYLMVGEDGGIFDFSGTPDGFKGSLGANPPARPITSVAVLETH